MPQQIYLADDTIAANIAFGENPKNINLNDIETATKIANIHEFISKELPLKYQLKLVSEEYVYLEVKYKE